MEPLANFIRDLFEPEVTEVEGRLCAVSMLLGFLLVVVLSLTTELDISVLQVLIVYLVANLLNTLLVGALKGRDP